MIRISLIFLIEPTRVQYEGILKRSARTMRERYSAVRHSTRGRATSNVARRATAFAFVACINGARPRNGPSAPDCETGGRLAPARGERKSNRARKHSPC